MLEAESQFPVFDIFPAADGHKPSLLNCKTVCWTINGAFGVKGESTKTNEA